MKKFYIKRITNFSLDIIVAIVNFGNALYTAIKGDNFFCFLSTIIFLIFYYSSINEIKKFKEALHLRKAIESVEVYLYKKENITLFNFNLKSEFLSVTRNPIFVINENEFLDFFKTLDKTTNTYIFYNDILQGELSLEESIKIIKQYKKRGS